MERRSGRLTLEAAVEAKGERGLDHRPDPRRPGLYRFFPRKACNTGISGHGSMSAPNVADTCSQAVPMKRNRPLLSPRDAGAPARTAQASGWLTLGEYALILALIAVGKVDSV